MKRITKSQDIVEIQRRSLARFLFEAEGDEKEEDGEDNSAEEPAADDVKNDKSTKPTKTDNIETAINDFLMKAEENALKQAAKTDSFEKAKDIGESRRLRSIRPLYEGPEQLTPQIDIRVFAGEVARLARNYRFLLDIERLIVMQAKDYLISKYDENHADELELILDDEYNISIKRTPGKPDGKLGVPNAAGARQSGA
jgi:hypothetical protein